MNSYEKEFIKFDTIKIRTNINNLISKNIEFNKNYNNEILIGEYYNSKNDKSIPYNLYIGISYKSQSLTLEFSSKVLLEDYPKLITKHTFRQCLENINQLGICSLDVDTIINDSHFAKVHVTDDIEFALTNDVLSSLNSCVNNYRRFKWERYRNEGIRFHKDVKSKSCQESIVVYDKEKEIRKNKDFLSSLENPSSVTDYFKGKVRFEMELDTPKKIREAFGVSEPYVMDVFNSTANPLLLQFDRVFGKGEIENSILASNYETYAMSAIIEKHNGDIKKIEQEMKDLNVYSSNSRNGLSERMKKIGTLIQQRNERLHHSSGILTEIREKLSH